MANNIAFELTANPIPVEEAFRRAGIAGDAAFKKVTDAEKKAQAELGVLENRLNSLSAAYQKAGDSSAQKRLSQAILEIQKRIEVATEKVNKFSNSVESVSTKTGFLSGQMQKLGGYVLAAFSIGAVISFEKEIIKTTALFDGLNKQLEFLGKDSGGAAPQIAYINNLVERLGLELVSTTQAYIQFAIASTQSGLSISKTQKIFTSVSEAVTAMHLPAERAELVFLALQQMISKGVVSAEELRRQMGDSLPGAFSIAAKSMGVTEKEFNKLLQTGKIISSEFLPKFADELHKTFGPQSVIASDSLPAALNRDSTAWTELKENIGELQPIKNAVKLWGELISAIGKGFEVINKGTTAVYLSDLQQKQLDQVHSVIKKINEQFDAKKISTDERRIGLQKLLNEGTKKEQQLSLERYQIESKLNTGTGIEIYEKKRKVITLRELIQGQQEYNRALMAEIDSLIPVKQEDIELTEKQRKEYERLQAQLRDLTHQYNLAKIELSSLSDIEQQEAVITENTRFEIEQQKIKFKETNATAEQQTTIINAITKKGEDSKKKIREDAAKEMEDFFIKSNEEHLKNVQLSAQRENDIIELADAKKEAQAIKAYEQQKANIESVNKALLNSSTVNKESIKGFKENRDAQLKAFDEQIKNEQNFFATGYQSREEFDKNTRKLQEDRKTFEIESEKQLWQKKLAVATYYGQAIAQVGNELANLKSAQLTKEQNDLQQAREAGIITEQTYNAQVREIQHKQFEINRIASLAQIVISTALAAANASVPAALTAYITLPELQAITIGIGAIQAAAVLGAPNPYAEGTKRVKGGRKGKDSVPYLEPNGWAMLMPDEMIVPEQKVRQHSPYLDNMFDGNISPRQSMWAADLFVSKRVSPGLLDYITSISGGRMNYNSTFTDRGIIEAIERKAVPNFQREAKQIVNAVTKLKSDNHRNWKR